MTIYQGQLDLICCTLGVEAWLQRLAWPGLPAFQAARRRPFYHGSSKQTAGFVRRHRNLAMWYIMDAGEPLATSCPTACLRQLLRMAGVAKMHKPVLLHTRQTWAGSIYRLKALSRGPLVSSSEKSTYL